MFKSLFVFCALCLAIVNINGNQLLSANTVSQNNQEGTNRPVIVLKDYKDFLNQLYTSSKSNDFVLIKDLLKTAQKLFPYHKNDFEYWKYVLKCGNPRSSSAITFSKEFKMDVYHPVVSGKGDRLYFCSYSNVNETGEDVYTSFKEGSDWSFPQVVSLFSSENNEGPSWANSNLSKFILVKFNYKNPNGDLFYINMEDDNPSPVIFPEPVNTKNFEADGRLFNDSVLFFSSDRPGGTGKFREKGIPLDDDYWGNTDIYVSILKEGKWGEVINLGPKINTEMAERTPFLSPDGKYLFFSSSGRIGFGGLDVFVSRRLSESSWTEWSEPVNVGGHVNSPLDDWGFMLIDDGKTAFFSNTKEILTCVLPDDFYGFEKQFGLRGKIKNELGSPIPAQIILTDLSTNLKIEQSNNPITGDFTFNLDPFSEYLLTASSSGYNPVSVNISFNSDTASIINRDITLISQSQVRIDTSDGLITVFFEFNKYNLEKSFHPKLDYVANLLKTQSEKSEVTIEIGGYTDAVGSEKYNEKLSLKRAQTVFGELIKRGLEDDSFDLKAYGESSPIAPNNTNEGRAKNRRVVLRIRN